jgi:DNA-binding CsgD family transcriptional regulator
MEVINQRSSPGVILFDSQGHFHFINQDARELIPSLGSGILTGEVMNLALPQELVDFVNKMITKPIPDDPFNEPFLHSAVMPSSWGIPLSVRGFLLSPSEKSNGNHQFLVLVEMIAENREINLSQIQKRFAVTDREFEVLKLVIEGCSNQEISGKLFISPYTVKDHIRHLKQKLGVPSRQMLIAAVVNR